MTAMHASRSSAASITDLVRFLLARMDEDDAYVKRVSRATHAVRAGVSPTGEPGSLERMRAEFAARRQILGSVQHLLVLRDQPSEKPVRDAAAQILRALASPYAAHGQYREEWRPLSR